MFRIDAHAIKLPLRFLADHRDRAKGKTPKCPFKMFDQRAAVYLHSDSGLRERFSKLTGCRAIPPVDGPGSYEWSKQAFGNGQAGGLRGLVLLCPNVLIKAKEGEYDYEKQFFFHRKDLQV